VIVCGRARQNFGDHLCGFQSNIVGNWMAAVEKRDVFNAVLVFLVRHTDGFDILSQLRHCAAQHRGRCFARGNNNHTAIRIM